jgi:hypothetical protein
MNHCLLCKEEIRKVLGQESTPDPLACWTHVAGGYVCRGARSEHDLATFDPNERVPASVADDYSI